jgi:hypothetical protein
MQREPVLRVRARPLALMLARKRGSCVAERIEDSYPTIGQPPKGETIAMGCRLGCPWAVGFRSVEKYDVYFSLRNGGRQPPDAGAPSLRSHGVTAPFRDKNADLRPPITRPSGPTVRGTRGAWVSHVAEAVGAPSFERGLCNTNGPMASCEASNFTLAVTKKKSHILLVAENRQLMGFAIVSPFRG